MDKLSSALETPSSPSSFLSNSTPPPSVHEKTLLKYKNQPFAQHWEADD